MSRSLKFSQAIKEAMDLCMAKDPSVFVMGLGVPDPMGLFGTATGLQEIYGPQRVMDMPASENAMTGVVIGAAITGMRPILTHQRVDFALLSMEQIVNQAANWHYMFGGQMRVPIVIRMIIGRGWGQGPQHSQGLQAHFAHVPGLKVVMPATPRDAKGLLIASIEDDNPVIFMEHRWLYNICGEVPEGVYRVELGRAAVVRPGTDLTIVATSYMVLEALRAADILHADGVDVEVIDVRTLKPLDTSLILDSVSKTGGLVVVDLAWQTCGFASEIVALVVEGLFEKLKHPPKRVTLPDCPTPTSRTLAKYYYPRAIHIARAAYRVLGRTECGNLSTEPDDLLLDVPDPSFTGPF